MSAGRLRMAFVSPTFLFPNDTGGRIRTTNILKGLKDGAFDITLLMPATQVQQAEWHAQIALVCDRVMTWQPSPVRPRWMRALDLLSDVPVSVAADRTAAGIAAVSKALDSSAFDVAVFDFVHSAVLRPAREMATVCFTHNVEAEIFGRHAQQSRGALMRRVWTSQCEKMRRFENDTLHRFTSVIAVSERDAQQLRSRYGVAAPVVIPTGVDLDFFQWREPAPMEDADVPSVVFTGSMDWDANIDGVTFFLDQVWPLVTDRLPAARFVVVGRKPPQALVERARQMRGVTVTGFVDDVRPHVAAAHAFVIPLRVGGGTRIKAFEAMAMGCPVVSTAIGIEGLDVKSGDHYLRGDTAPELADALLRLLGDFALRRRLSRDARTYVEANYGHRVPAQVFEQTCLNAARQFPPDPRNLRSPTPSSVPAQE
jgi:glycosyltransferase involved in cell wall biosynthesis